MRILFTGGRAPATLELIRNFGRNGATISLAESFDKSISKYSKCVKNNHNVCSPRTHTKKYINQIINIIKKDKIDILFPTCEEIFYISKYKQVINKKCRNVKIVADDFDKLSLLHNKKQFINFASDLGLLVPKTHSIKSLKQVNDIVDFEKLDKCVLKPVFSRFGSKVIIFTNPEAVANVNLEKEQYILQEFIAGNVICSYAYAEKGELKFNICYKNELVNKMPVATSFYPYHSEKVNKIVKRIVNNLNFTGNISFDFIEKANDYYLLECNPRITSGIHMIENNYIKLFFEKDMQELKLIPKQIFILTIINSLRTINIKLFLNSLVTKDIVFSIRDLRPFFGQVRSLIELKKISKNKKITISQASTVDIEWNGEKT